MTQYSRSIRTSATSSGVAAVEIIAGPYKLVKIAEIGINLVNATASVFGLGRPAAKGITPTTPVPFLSPLTSSSPTDAALAVAWGTGPTIPAAFFRQCSLPATVGAEKIWKFDQKLTIPINSSIILWTLSAVSIADIYFVIEE